MTKMMIIFIIIMIIIASCYSDCNPKLVEQDSYILKGPTRKAVHEGIENEFKKKKSMIL